MKNRKIGQLILWEIIFLLLAAACLPAPGVYAVEEEKLEEQIIECFYTGKSADITEFNINQQTLQEIFENLLYSGKLPWLTETYSYEYESKTGTVTEITPEYQKFSPEEINLYEQKTAEILDEAVLQGMPPWEIALSVHDYLIVHSQYDLTEQKFSAYDLITGGSAVCDGYSFAYMDLMNRAGVPCKMVRSPEMNHSWNLVMLDGAWYHVDLTWDDPAPDVEGMVRHDYFLKTDDQMDSGELSDHYAWNTDVSCENTSYSDGFWENIQDQIVFLNTDDVIWREKQNKGQTIVKQSLKNEEKTVLLQQYPNYYDIGQGEGNYSNHGLTLWNNRIYFSSMDQVCSIAIGSDMVRTEFTYDVTGNQKFIAGCFVDQDQLYLSIADQNYQVISEKVSLDPTGYHIHQYEPILTESTKENPGYTTYQCSCGIHYRGDWQPTTGVRNQTILSLLESFGFRAAVGGIIILMLLVVLWRIRRNRS